MKRVGSREFKNRQAYYLRRVRKGETILVTDHGKPVAKVEPITSDNTTAPGLEEKLQELAAQGHLRLGTKPFKPFQPVVAKGKPASRIIIEDRD
ncbi:MAG: type II toxin-antitoxin system Phd/YefM family antitoxin [Candidatus Acidiferrales bacterium]|jgi:prevent-host-death family protein|nr:type II toxin-antitoxin system prevent-host-death family antitoxin [Acidobacteriota bacterium]MCH7985973.1 type II toxin-antitoxin system prevent-host-death family antitoxin [Acidobacteriota bacterium]MCH8947809.1 type II toxin-antitoxin system prevent-host-death family antitoxin [Acidobacteriota bacterium]